MKRAPFPVVSDPENLPVDGAFVATPTFCARAYREKCTAHYQLARDKGGLLTCPYGFSTYVGGGADGQRIILTGIRIQRHYDRRRLRSRLGNDFNPSMSLKEFAGVLNRWTGIPESSQLMVAAPSVESKRSSLRRAPQVSRSGPSADLVQFALHETRKLNAQIKRFSEELLRSADSNATEVDVPRRAHNIFAASSLISVRLNAYDLEQNPLSATAVPRQAVGVFKKFEKASHCLRMMAAESGKHFNMTGASFATIPAYEIFDILPFILLENAMKYSPSGEEIIVNFVEMGDRLSVRVLSSGPRLDVDEEKFVFDKGFRGRHASAEIEGSGYGLYVAKLICEMHDIAMSAKSGERLSERAGHPQSRFVVTLDVPLTGERSV